MSKEVTNALSKYNLTTESYEQCLDEASKKVDHLIDKEWSEIIDKYKLPIHYDTLRKASQTIFGGAFVYKYFKEKTAGSNSSDVAEDYIREIDKKLQDLEKAKVRFRDQRNDLHRQLRNEARLEENFSIIEKLLEDKGRVEFNVHDSHTEHDDQECDFPMVVCLSDLHIGAAFDSCFGYYNSGIAKARLEEYLNEVLSIQKLHNSKTCYVSLIGDLISGSIHKSIQVTNREDVISQIELCSECIATFIYELSKHFENVNVVSVSGNHSRIDKKDDALKDERLDRLIDWFAEKLLSHIDNINFIHSEDSTYTRFTIGYETYVAVHGDYDTFSEAGVAKLALALGFKPYAILSGHKHTPAAMIFSNVRMIQSGSLAGSGDDFTVQKRLVGKPSQTTLVCKEDGSILARYDVELD